MKRVFSVLTILSLIFAILGTIVGTYYSRKYYNEIKQYPVVDAKDLSSGKWKEGQYLLVKDIHLISLSDKEGKSFSKVNMLTTDAFPETYVNLSEIYNNEERHPDHTTLVALARVINGVPRVQELYNGYGLTSIHKYCYGTLEDYYTYLKDDLLWSGGIFIIIGCPLASVFFGLRCAAILWKQKSPADRIRDNIKYKQMRLQGEKSHYVSLSSNGKMKYLFCLFLGIVLTIFGLSCYGYVYFISYEIMLAVIGTIFVIVGVTIYDYRLKIK